MHSVESSYSYQNVQAKPINFGSNQLMKDLCSETDVRDYLNDGAVSQSFQVTDLNKSKRLTKKLLGSTESIGTVLNSSKRSHDHSKCSLNVNSKSFFPTKTS